MTEQEKKENTEIIKQLETEAHQIKTKLEFIQKQIEIAYKYEDELAGRMMVAKKNSENLRQSFFIGMTELNDTIHKMKRQLDIFTGNFYSI